MVMSLWIDQQPLQKAPIVAANVTTWSGFKETNRLVIVKGKEMAYFQNKS